MLICIRSGKKLRVLCKIVYEYVIIKRISKALKYA